MAEIEPALYERCARLIYELAEQFQIPPVYITCHIKQAKPCEARLIAMRTMITDFGMSRQQVALFFRRDLRRVRRSVLGV